MTRHDENDTTATSTRPTPSTQDSKEPRLNRLITAMLVNLGAGLVVAAANG
jgi:hypothetical protein